MMVEDSTPKRTKVFAALSTLLGTLIFTGIIVYAINESDKAEVFPEASTSTYSVPSVTTSDYGLLLGDEDAPVTISIYEDPFCSHCADFSEVNGENILSKINTGSANVKLHLMTFQDQYSSDGTYSTRAANAVTEVANTGDGALTFEFLGALYATGGDISDNEIAEIALNLGVESDVVNSFGELKYKEWLDASEQVSYEDGVTGTPTIFINDYPLREDWRDPEVLDATIARVRLLDDA